MNQDLISRQGVIEVLSQYPFEKVVNCISIIEEFPSAQPEHLVKESGNLVKGLVNDLISRQEALYILDEEKREIESCLAQETDKNVMQYEDGYLAAVEKIAFSIKNSLGTEARRCKDCRHRYLENNTWHCPFGLSGGEDFFCGYSVQQTPSEQPEHTETHACDYEHTETHDWIPVTERQPYHELAIVQFSDGDFSLLQFPTAYRWKDIVAWMPLPEPYKEEER